MLKTMSIALLAASILAAPALAAKPAAASVAQTRTSQMTTGAVKSPAAKSHLRKVGRHHRPKHQSLAHRHHMKVSTVHASAKQYGTAKTRLGLHKTSHIKMRHKVGSNQLKAKGPRLSAKHATPAMRRG